MFSHLPAILFTREGDTHTHPWEAHPQEEHPPQEAHPLGSTHPRKHTPPEPPPLRRSLQRTVRILLECFLVYYQLQWSCGQGNIFTPVCHSFCSRGGRGSASVHAGMPPPGPPVGADTPWSRHPPGPDTPLGAAPHPPGADTPLDQTPSESRLQHTVYERPVRILLECILVMNSLTVEFSAQTKTNKKISTSRHIINITIISQDLQNNVTYLYHVLLDLSSYDCKPQEQTNGSQPK